MQNSTNASTEEKSTVFKTMKKLFKRPKNDAMEIEDKKSLLKNLCSLRREAIRQRNKAVSKQLRYDEFRKRLLHDIETCVAVNVSECPCSTCQKHAKTISKLSESIKRSNEAIPKLNDIIINCSEQTAMVENM